MPPSVFHMSSKMKLYSLRCGFVILSGIALLAVPQSLIGQAMGQTTPPTPKDPREYVQSSSPLGDGSHITSRSDAGGDPRIYLSQAPRGYQGYAATPTTTGYQPSGPWQTAPWGAVPPNQQGTGYGYPTTAQVPTNTLGLAPVGQGWGQAGTGAYQQTSYSAPPNCSSCAGVGSYPMQVQYPNPTTGQLPAQPSYSAGFQPFQSWGAPAAPTSANRVNYTPLLGLRNLPPGTYLGQGIIGQPKAYVDGEPVRNLFRYILP